MSRILFVFVPLLFACPWASAEIFKCIKGGEAVYQNFPCSIDSIGSQATAPKPPDPAVSAAPQNQSTRSGDPASTEMTPQRASAEAAFGKLVNGKYEPRIGMTKGQVRRLSWGEPKDIERTESGEDRIEVWTYPDKRKLVFGPDGRLSTVQNQ